MKHLILTLPLTALCLLSCSSSKDDGPYDPDPDTQLDAIAFGGNGGAWEDAPATRAATTGLESLFQTFRVWGYKTTDAAKQTVQTVMDGYKVAYRQNSAGTTETNAADWEYVGVSNDKWQGAQTVKYWDYGASSYRFFGYTPFDANATAVRSGEGSADDAIEATFPFEYADDATATSIPYASEMWLATNTANGKSYGQQVTLAFSPLIAKVRFKFTYPDGTTSVTITDIQFQDSRFATDADAADTPLRGTLTAVYPLRGEPQSVYPSLKWTPATQNATGNIVMTMPYETADDNIHIIQNPADYDKWYYVPPLDIIPYEQGAYTMTARIDGNFSTAVIPSQYMQWRAGFQYTYIFKITEAGTLITFADLEVEKWLPGTDIENKGSGTEGW